MSRNFAHRSRTDRVVAGEVNRLGFPLRRHRAATRRDPLSFLHRSVRAATRNEQMMIETILAALDLQQPEPYGLLLNVHHTALQVLEPDWRSDDRDDFSLMMQHLRDDLREFGALPSRLFLIAPGTLNADNRLGLSYIIRTLYLSAHSLRARVPAEFPAAYLSASPRTSWHQFLREVARTLEDHTIPGGVEDIVLGAQFAAQKVAKIFESALSYEAST